MPSFILQAWRSWKSGKAVAVVAALALAVGIGSTTAIYTVVNSVMLKPLPYPAGERWVALYRGTFSQPDQWGGSRFPDLQQFGERTHSFDVYGWFRPENFNLTSPGQPQQINGAAVTAALAQHIGVNPMMGRWFQDDTGVVISYALWKRLGADANIVGKAVAMQGRSYTVTGVMPPAFRLPVPGPGTETRSDVWISLDPRGIGQNRDDGYYFGYARRRPGVSFAQAEADVKRIAAEIAKQDPAGHPSFTAKLNDLQAGVSMDIKPTLLLLFAAAGLLLLITCANVAGVLLARAVARARDGDASGVRRRPKATGAPVLHGRIVRVSGWCGRGRSGERGAGAHRSVNRGRLHPARRRDRHRLEGAAVRGGDGVPGERAIQSGAAVAGRTNIPQ